MKKLLGIVGIFVLIILAAMIVLPQLFKDEINQLIKDSVNENINAKVEFEDIGINLFSSFPNFAVSVEDLSIINNPPFEGDTVITARSINLSVEFLSLISGDIIKINSILLDSPRAIIYVLEDGSANYNWTKTEDETVGTEASADTAKSAKFNVELEEYNISNGRFAFIDQMSNIVVGVDELNHAGSGDFSEDNFLLNTETSISALTIEMDGIRYLNGVNTELDMQLEVNLPNMKFMVKDNRLRLNNLLLQFDGSVEMPDENLVLDLNFSSPRSEFKDIISLIPAIYKSDFNDIKTSGTMGFNGYVKGVLAPEKLPAFDINLSVENGNFRYPDLPTEVRNVNLDLNLKNNNGEFDNTVLNISSIKMELGSDPIECMLVLSKLETGPVINTKIKGRLDLENVKNAFDLKNIIQLEGIIQSNFEAQGNISNASSNFEKINAGGQIDLSNIIYQESSESDIIRVESAELKFNPKSIRLKNFKAELGKSDLFAEGNLNNLIAYIISDGKMYGNLDIRSEYFDLNPFIKPDEGPESVSESDSLAETAAFDIPKNIEFILQSKFSTLLYDNLTLKNVTGNIEVKESRISLKNLNMNLLNGSLAGNGFYAKSEYQENPDIEFNLKVNNLDINQTYNKFLSVKQFAPIAKYIQGTFSSNLKLNTKLDNSLTPVWETFFSNGMLKLKNAQIKNFKPFTTVGSLLNMEELSNPQLNKVNPKFEIKNGRFYVSPFDYKVGNTTVVLSGSNGLDQSIDYKMDIKVPAEKLKNQANKTISGLIGKDINLVKSNTINVQAFIGGKIDDPKVRTSASDAAADAAEQVQNAVVAEVEARTDSLKNAAEQKLKEEAKKKEMELKKKEEEIKKKLEEEAKKKLKKMFGFG